MSEVIDNVPEIKDLPTNVQSKDQLALLPDKYLSDDPTRPLLLGTFKFALRPLYYSVLFILVIEGLERFTYYGINNTETAFLTGAYQPNWNANMTDVQAASYTSASIGIAYTAPFIGGIVADGFLGDYWSIIFGVAALYIPGLILIALTTFPYLLGPTFNLGTLTAGLLALMPLGTGFIKSIVNVFGAKQYHPLLQTSQIETYYVNFYLAINVGALIGGILIPIVAEFHIQIAYLIPVCSLLLGLLVFLAGTSRYVRRPPEKTAMKNTLQLIGKRVVCKPFDKSKISQGGSMEDSFVDGVKRLLLVVPICLLILPFSIAYSQIATVFILQGEAMEQIGILDASLMTNFDPIFVLLAGFGVGSYLYPFLAKKGVKIPLTYKFAIGTAFGSLSIISAIIVDHFVRNKYNDNGTQIPIIWQAFNYAFIGFGEIFAIASCMEAAYSIAPKEQKGFASAINQFLTIACASFICVGLNNLCRKWFPNASGGGSTTEQYANSEMGKYMWVLFGITILGIIINILPPVKNWAESLHQKAIEASATVAFSDSLSDSSEASTDDPQADLEDSCLFSDESSNDIGGHSKDQN